MFHLAVLVLVCSKGSDEMWCGSLDRIKMFRFSAALVQYVKLPLGFKRLMVECFKQSN
jgi:hypothetical protein